ncbi:hypothetical protein PI87_19400 [Ralstonia sp. A12]|uniref:DUF4123 domain-containing protein n=1 Tax=Ralstonia sp. A12 TaxID=1217052 RepID=UPI000573BE6E|nr:DUF4123 domain-containing protein [Ralstonia sp. A12]KHK52933.1 hypothetical protein PI87_19400 [Ralstonia sp. A12]
MPHRTLADLEQVLLDPVSEQASDAPHDAIALCEALAADYHARKRRQAPEDRPLRVYLLLDRWDGSQFAVELSDAWPEAVAERVAVPDAFYAGREGEAPCVVPLPDIALPDGSADTFGQVKAQETLARWLLATNQQAYQRLVRQDVCAVVASADSAASVAQHLAKLGLQYPPGDRAARLFRYQDPRVMQRVWPELSATQQGAWLGPMQAWWTLMQPWGPWAQEELMASDARTVPSPVWFKAEQPTIQDAQTEALMLNRLMSARQWQAAHASPWGHQSWAALASVKVPMDQQPDGVAMSAAIAQGQRLGLDDQDLEAFIALSWLLPGEEQATHAHARDWEDQQNQRALEHVLHQMRSQPGSRFTSAWLSAQTLFRP